MKKVLIAVVASFCLMFAVQSFAQVASVDVDVEVDTTADADANSTSVSHGGAGGQGGSGGNGYGGNASATGGNATATGGSANSSLEYNEAQQHLAPMPIDMVEHLQTPSHDGPGPTVYGPDEVIFLQHIYTRQELLDMAGPEKPYMRGGLKRKASYQAEGQSPSIAFYLRIPAGVQKKQIQRVGMLMLDARSEITTAELFGHMGLMAMAHGANAVIVTATGFQREEKAFSIGSGASIASASGGTTVGGIFPIGYAKRWKKDEAWIRGIACCIPPGLVQY